MGSFSNRSDFMAGPMNPQGFRQNLPTFTAKAKPKQEIGFASTIGMLRRQQVVSGFRNLNPSTFGVGQLHAYPRGRPNPRLAMIFRCTSLVPAAMV